MEKRKASLGFYCGALLFCFYFTFGIFGSMLTIYLSDLGKTPVEIAFVLSASGIFAIALQPVVGFLDDRIKNRKALGDVAGLARSIEVNGQITPLIAVADGEAYQLVAGHRRTAAMKSLGLEEADAYVMDGWDDARIAQILNAENNHRRELTEAERGRGIQTMLSLGVPVSDAAATAGAPVSWPS